MTNEGDVIVGLQYTTEYNAVAIKYSNGQYSCLEAPAGSNSRANGISDDAEVISGWYTNENGFGFLPYGIMVLLLLWWEKMLMVKCWQCHRMEVLQLAIRAHKVYAGTVVPEKLWWSRILLT